MVKPRLERLSTNERIIAWRLALGRTVATAEFIEALYSGRQDGGPTAIASAIGRYMYGVRHKLRDHGVDVVTIGRMKGSLGFLVERHQIPLLLDLLAEEVAFYTPGRVLLGPVVRTRKRVTGEAAPVPASSAAA